MRHRLTREWRKVHMGMIQNLHYSLCIIRVIKSRKMICTGYVEILVGKYEARDNLEMGGYKADLK
jgi:hypothetical protein